MDGEIDFEEFALLMTPSVSDIVAKFRYAHRTVDDVRKAFKTYDKDGDGAIDKGELIMAMTNYKFGFSEQEAEIIFKEGDIDGDGTVNFEEFMYLMCPTTEQVVRKFRQNYKTINEVKNAFRQVTKINSFAHISLPIPSSQQIFNIFLNSKNDKPFTFYQNYHSYFISESMIRTDLDH